jgi:N-acetylmuramoyl-L-alanine amidase
MPAPYIVAIDPGHGGSATQDPAQLWDPGVVVGNVMEKEITLDLAFRLRALLQKERVKVILTRTRDEYIEISERWNRVQASGARLFVSLHVNAYDGDPSINGATVLYPRSESLPFAQTINTALADNLKAYQIADDGVVLKPELWIHSDIPTATIEPVYLTNPREANLLQQGEFRNAIVHGVFNGLLAADPQIEATKQQIERAEAAAGTQRRAQQVAATDAARTATAVRWGGIVGGLLLLWVLMRVALRRPARASMPPAYRRRTDRRRRPTRRF